MSKYLPAISIASLVSTIVLVPLVLSGYIGGMYLPSDSREKDLYDRDRDFISYRSITDVYLPPKDKGVKIYFSEGAKLTGNLSEIEIPLENRQEQNRRLKEQSKSGVCPITGPIIIERTVLILSLTQPIDVLDSRNSKSKYYQDRLNVTKVQLTTSSDMEKELASFKNKKVSILCLDMKPTGVSGLTYHATEVVCNVGKIIEIGHSEREKSF